MSHELLGSTFLYDCIENEQGTFIKMYIVKSYTFFNPFLHVLIKRIVVVEMVFDFDFEMVVVAYY